MNATFFKWEDKYSVRSCMLDDQHKKLIEVTNELYNAFTSNLHKQKLGHIIDELHDYTIYHFVEEEKLLKNLGFKLSEQHLQEHDEFKKKITDFRTKYIAGRLAVTYEVMHFLRSWLVEHILGTDKEYVGVFAVPSVSKVQ